MALTSQAIAITGAAVTSVTLASGSGFVTIFNRAGTDEAFITSDGTVPTVAGASTYYLPKVIGASVVVPVPRAGGTLKVISTASQSLWLQV